MLVGSGGIAASAAIFIKTPKEANKLVIDAAQGAVVVQSGVIKDLREELARQDEKMNELAKAHQACEDKYDTLLKLVHDIDERKRRQPSDLEALKDGS